MLGDFEKNKQTGGSFNVLDIDLFVDKLQLLALYFGVMHRHRINDTRHPAEGRYFQFLTSFSMLCFPGPSLRNAIMRAIHY